jgi:hypothetical protein
MGTHNRRPTTNLSEKTKVVEPGKLPNNIGKRRCIPTIKGDKKYMVIRDEILHKQHNNPRKLIAFQRIEFEEDKRIEYRLGYYMIGEKAGMKGRWVWGQFCLQISEKDLKAILKEAKKRRWF